MKLKELKEKLSHYDDESDIFFEISGHTPDGEKDYFQGWFESIYRPEEKSLTIRLNGED